MAPSILDRLRRIAPRVVRTPEAAFWAWFVANEAMIWDFERHPERVAERVFPRLARVDPDLGLDFGSIRGGRRELVVTANGVVEAFPAVVRLAAAAPPLRRWRVVSFRPRRGLQGDLHMLCGDTVRMEDVRFAADVEDGRLAVDLFVPGYRRTPTDEFGRVGSLLLDLAVGELDARTRVERVIVRPLLDARRGRPIAELPCLVDTLPIP